VPVRRVARDNPNRAGQVLVVRNESRVYPHRTPPGVTPAERWLACIFLRRFGARRRGASTDCAMRLIC
jgi:hypothetical protein